MTDQLSIFDTPPDDADVEPQRTPDVEVMGPNEFYIAPFGRVVSEPLTGLHERGIDALFKVIDKAADHTRERSVMWTFCDLWWAALQRFEGGEERYMEIVDELDRETLGLATQGFAILRDHFVDRGYMSDLLGAVFMRCRSEWGGGWADQEFTPWAVCRMKARMAVEDMEAERLESGPAYTVCDPACGSGSLLLALRAQVAKKWGRRALAYVQCYGQDIDHLCVTMTRIQLTMSNVPWMLSLLSATVAEMRRSE
ncbi:MAG: N-6 DNA methylase [Trueperaceae bacterium]|nr:N-6 DNA methylase [Trueperaceae bacterium]